MAEMGDGANYWPDIVPHFEQDPSYLERTANCITCTNQLTVMDRQGPALSPEAVEETCGPVAILPCGHIMGLPCLNTWLEAQMSEYNVSCPVCRASLRHQDCQHRVSIARLWPGTSERTQRVSPSDGTPRLCVICRLLDVFRHHLCGFNSTLFLGAVLSFDFTAYSHVLDETVARQFRVCFAYRDGRDGPASEGDQVNGAVLRRTVRAALDQYSNESAGLYQPGSVMVRVRHFDNMLRDGDRPIDPHGMLYGNYAPLTLDTSFNDMASYRHFLLEYPSSDRVAAGSSPTYPGREESSYREVERQPPRTLDDYSEDRTHHDHSSEAGSDDSHGTFTFFTSRGREYVHRDGTRSFSPQHPNYRRDQARSPDHRRITAPEREHHVRSPDRAYSPRISDDYRQERMGRPRRSHHDDEYERTRSPWMRDDR